MGAEPTPGPESTAVRVALWRAMHVQIDPPPHVFEDVIGLQLAAPDEGWKRRPDMDPDGTKFFRASIIARARFLDDLVMDQAARGVDQYVILGAGLDTFAQRRPEIASRLTIYEVDRAGPQTWKRQRLIELGFGLPENLRFVAVEFEAGDNWWERLPAEGFDMNRPAVVAATGVSMYLTTSAINTTLRAIAQFAAGSTLAMTFMMPLEFAEPALQPALEFAVKGARASGAPFISFFMPEEMISLARDAGFKEARHVSAQSLAERYFADRADGLRPPTDAEELLVAST